MSSTLQYWLGPRRAVNCGALTVRVKDDLRRAVVFVGYQPPGASFAPIGTAFFLRYFGFPYLVTAGHVARELGHDPFVIRMNKRDGIGAEVTVDMAKWVYHEDRTVDVAVLMGGPTKTDEVDWVSFGEDFLLSREKLVECEIGAGDDVHIIGLYRFLHGKKRNLPIVHTGAIALMADDEPIPVKDSITDEIYYTNGFLVEAQTLSGLSGSPVFVDKTWRVRLSDKTVIKTPADTLLLGVWQSAWNAPPDELKALSVQKGVTVPVGMGLVMPAYRIIEILESDQLRLQRETLTKQRDAENAASEQLAPSTTAGNPSHKEDFNSLLTSVARGKKSADET